MNLNDLAYYTDSRVRSKDGRDWAESLDEKTMTAKVIIYDEDEDVEELITTPFKYEVCPTCDGKGSHVNPSIDAHGLSAEDFYNDPDFAYEYRSGSYDVPCYGCNGQRVVPVPTDERVVKHIQRWVRDLASMRAEQLAEMRMGA